MTATVEQAVTTLLTLSQSDDQTNVQGVALTHYYDAYARSSQIANYDVQAYRLSLADDTRAMNQLEALLLEAKGMLGMVYAYRGCAKAVPKIPEGPEEVQSDLYKETFRLLDTEILKIKELHRWYARACAQVAGDLGWFWRGSGGPSWTHMWGMIRVLDSLLLLDHLKNNKTSLLDDLNWYKRAFPKLPRRRNDGEDADEIDQLLEFLTQRWAVLLRLKIDVCQATNAEDMVVQLVGFCMENLEGAHTVLWRDRLTLLRVLPLLLVLATPTEKDGDMLFRKKLKLERVLRHLRREPVTAAFEEVYIIPASILPILSPFFRKLVAENRLELPLGTSMDPADVVKVYGILPNLPAMQQTHDELCLRFTAIVTKIRLAKEARDKPLAGSDGRSATEPGLGRELRQDALSASLEGLLLLSKWTGRLAQHFAWKCSHPLSVGEAQAASMAGNPRTPEQGPITSYERAIRYNMSGPERRAVVRVLEHIRGVGAMMRSAGAAMEEALWEAVHGEIQEFVRTTLAVLLKKHAKKSKSEVAGILSCLKGVAGDWMGGSEEVAMLTKNKSRRLLGMSGSLDPVGPKPHEARAVPPSPAQMHCIEHLVHTLLLGSATSGRGGFFGERDLSASELREFHAFLHRLLLFRPVISYQGTLQELTSVSFLWFREWYLEIGRALQFPVECSVPWMLMDALLEEGDPSQSQLQDPSLASVLLPLGIYNDAANSALYHLRQQFLYDEVEAELDLCFDQLVFKTSERVFSHFKTRAACLVLDKGFVASVERGRQGRLRPPPRLCEALLGQTHVQLLGRDINLRALLTHRLNRLFRKNLDFILDRLDASDLTLAVEGQQQLEVLRAAHNLLGESLALDPFPAMLAEAAQAASLTSFTARVADYVNREVVHDLLPNFLWCTASQRFVRVPSALQAAVHRAAAPRGKESFLYGTKDLNEAFGYCAILHSRFVGLPHLRALVALLGPHSLPPVVQHCLDLIAQRVTVMLAPSVAELLPLLPNSLGLPPFHIGLPGSMEYLQLQLASMEKEPRLPDVVVALRDIGSLLAFLSLLDTALRHAETTQLLQAAPWLGVVPGTDGQLQQLPATGEGGLPGDVPAAPLSDLLQRAAASAPATEAPILGVLQAAQVAEAMYWSGVQGESLLVHALGYLDAALEALRQQWAPHTPRGRGAELEFHRLYSVIQFILCDADMLTGQSRAATSEEHDSDAVAWGACAVIYLLGQHRKFELTDLSYHLLRVAEFEAKEFPEAKAFLVRAQRAKRLNAHVMSMLRAHLPQPLKPAYVLNAQGLPTSATYPLPHSDFYPVPPYSESEFNG